MRRHFTIKMFKIQVPTVLITFLNIHVGQKSTICGPATKENQDYEKQRSGRIKKKSARIKMQNSGRIKKQNSGRIKKQNSGRIKKKSAQPSRRFKALHAKKMNIRCPVKKTNKILLF